MAQRRTNTEPPPVEVRDFTADEIEQGIKKIRRRISDVEGLDPGQVRYDDASVKNVESNIRDTVRDVFGPNSSEFREHKQFRIPHGPIYRSRSNAEMQEQFTLGIPQKITRLKGLISRLEEKRLDLMPEKPKGQAQHPRTFPTNAKAIVLNAEKIATQASSHRIRNAKTSSPQGICGRSTSIEFFAASDVAGSTFSMYTCFRKMTNMIGTLRRASLSGYLCRM